jgi:sugar phosphate isomerase/epimerase
LRFMQEAISKYFKLGLIPTMAFPRTDVNDYAQLRDMLLWVARNDAFEAFEIGYMQDERSLDLLADLLGQSHMDFCYAAQSALMTNGLNANALDEDQRMQAEQMLERCIDQAERIGATRLVFLAGRFLEEEKEAALRQLKKTTLHICKYAKARNIHVEIEPFDFDIAKKSLIGPVETTARFAAEVCAECSNFGILVDLSHIPMLYDKPQHVIQGLRPYITHFHIGNTVCGCPQDEGYGDEHQRFGFPHSANDTQEVLEFLRILQKEGFFNAQDPYLLSFEVKPWKDEESTLIVANALRVLHRAWAKL